MALRLTDLLRARRCLPPFPNRKTASDIQSDNNRAFAYEDVETIRFTRLTAMLNCQDGPIWF